MSDKNGITIIWNYMFNLHQQSSIVCLAVNVLSQFIEFPLIFKLNILLIVTNVKGETFLSTQSFSWIKYKILSLVLPVSFKRQTDFINTARVT